MNIVQDENRQAVPMKSKGRGGPRGSGKFSTPFTTGATKALHAWADKHEGREAPQAHLIVYSAASACFGAETETERDHNTCSIDMSYKNS